jgi:uncharacterized protein
VNNVKIATNLSLPVDVVTQTVAVVAKRRSGKSFLARRLVEQLHHATQQVVIVDPKGDWWGVLYARDGKSAGLPFVIFGGERGHIPLGATGGELVAKLVVEERVSALLDLSGLRKHEVATFMGAFLEALYRLKAREQYRTPVMLVIDEADAIAPQKPQPNEARMLGAAEDIVRRGGQRGIGCTLITQRTAVLNKNVLTQAQVLIALRTVAPQDLQAMQAWIDVHGEDAERKVLMASLPALPVGDAWVWSPGWPTDRGIFERIHTLPIETYDSGATPKPGEKRIEPKTAAEVDLVAVRRQMAETIERAKADDPRELRRQLAAEKAARAKLQAELDEAKSKSAAGKAREVLVLNAADRKVLGKAHAALTRALDTFTEAVQALPSILPGLDDIAKRMNAALEHKPSLGPLIVQGPGVAPTHRPPSPSPAHIEAGPGSTEVGAGGLRRMLIALAQRPQGLTNRQLGVRACLSSASGTFSTYLSRGRQAGWIADVGTVRCITAAGLQALGSYEPLPTGAKLLEHWLGELGQSGAARILRALADAYPRALTNAELGDAAQISPASGTFSTYVSRLRTLELVEGGRGQLKASAELFS